MTCEAVRLRLSCELPRAQLTTARMLARPLPTADPGPCRPLLLCSRTLYSATVPRPGFARMSTYANVPILPAFRAGPAGSCPGLSRCSTDWDWAKRDANRLSASRRARKGPLQHELAKFDRGYPRPPSCTPDLPRHSRIARWSFRMSRRCRSAPRRKNRFKYWRTNYIRR